MSHPAFPYLTVLVLLPAGGALASALMVRVRREVVEGFGIAVAIATLGLAIALTVLLHAGDGGYQFGPATCGRRRSVSPGSWGWTGSRSSSS